MININTVRSHLAPLPVKARYCFFLTTFLLAACNDFIQPPVPKDQLIGSQVFENDKTALAALQGIYSEMSFNTGFAGGGINSVTYLSGLSSDEFDNHSNNSTKVDIYANNITSSNSDMLSLWSLAYRYIYCANTLEAAVSKSTGITPELAKQLTGHARFIRSFCYFYLVSLFGDVPLVLSTDYRENATTSRTSSQLVYNQIIRDLKSSQELLPEDFSLSKGERTMPNRWAATALLARAYLFRQEWTEADKESSKVLDCVDYRLAEEPEDAFLKNSSETIWQLMPVVPGRNTMEAVTFIITATPTNASLSESLLSAFEPLDKRLLAWVNHVTINGNTYYFPAKYKTLGGAPIVEYSMVMRLSEQYLIRAEARLHTNDLAGALEDINVIRSRVGLENLPGNVSQPILAKEIDRQRQLEFFAEWGHRWFDLKRTGQVDDVLSKLPFKHWDANDAWYPIPETEIIRNERLTQNPGY